MKRRELKNVALIFALAVVVVLFTVLTDGSFLSARNLSNLLRQISVNGILAIGMTLVILTGGIDLSIGSVLAFTGVLAGFSQAHWGWSETGASGALGSMTLALVGSFATGLTNGVLIGYVGIPAFVISLGMMVIARGLAFIISDGQTQSPIGDFFSTLGGEYISAQASLAIVAVVVAGGIALKIAEARRSKRAWALPKIFALTVALSAVSVYTFSYRGIPIPVLLLFLLFIATQALLQHTRWGRYVYAIGGNPEAARLAGVPNKLMLLTVYTAMGLCCGLASVVTVGRLNAASPSEGQLMELDAIAAVVIGGTSLMGGSGTLVGSLVGVLMIGMLNNGMSLMDVPTYYQWVIKGVVIILAVIIDKKATRST